MRKAPRSELVQVSAGLARDGGGTAVMARQIARAAGEFAQAAGLTFRLFDLAGDDGDRGQHGRGFAGDRTALSLAVWRLQVARTCAGLIFDHPGPARLQAFLPAGARAPYLVFLYGIDIWRGKGWDRRRALRQATELLTISEYSRERAREVLPWAPEPGIAYPALEEREPSDRVEPAVVEQAGTGYLLLVGRMSAGERYKGHDQLLAVLPELLRRRPEARLVFAGAGDDRARLEARARALGAAEHVYFPGFVGEATLRALYDRCAAFVMPSTEEGFGLVYLEAMRAAKPCIGARGSAAAEIIEHGRTGILVDRDDPRELLEASARLLADADYSHRLGLAGRERWRTRFTYEAFRAKLHSSLSRLTKRSDVRD